MRSLVKITLIIPSSNLRVYPTLREKTEFIGRIARALAIFKVESLLLVKNSAPEDVALFSTVLNYLLIPPYLRKKLVPMLKELRYVGLLPPLNIVTHNPENKRPAKGDLKEGIIKTSRGKTGKAFIGYKKDCYVRSPRTLRPGERVLLRVISTEPLRCIEEDPSQVKEYIGYKVLKSDVNDLHIKLSSTAESYIRVLTSKRGEKYTWKEARRLLKDIRKSRGLALFLGDSSKDFDELIPIEVCKKLKFSHVYNFIPGQGVLSVRTDEALWITLSQITFTLNELK